MIRAGTDDEILAICDVIGYAPSQDATAVILEKDDGTPGAAAIYDHWTHSGVQMHAWSDGPQYVFNPEFVREMFAYIFEQIEPPKMLAIAVTPCDNSPSLALAKFLGFTEICRIRDGWKPGTDMVIQELRRENCRFLEISDNVDSAPAKLN